MDNEKEKILKELYKHLDSFKDNCLNFPYEERGVTNIEAFYWWSLVGAFKPDIIIESGVYKGRSTHFLCQAQKYFNVPTFFAYDRSNEHEAYVRNKLKIYDFKYKICDGVNAIEKVCKKYNKSKILFIVDGPKSGEPFKRILRAAFSCPNFCAIGVHDCYEFNSESGQILKEENKYNLLFTDKEINKSIRDLNSNISDDIVNAMKKMDREYKIDLMECIGICYNHSLLLETQ